MIGEALTRTKVFSRSSSREDIFGTCRVVATFFSAFNKHVAPKSRCITKIFSRICCRLFRYVR